MKPILQRIEVKTCNEGLPYAYRVYKRVADLKVGEEEFFKINCIRRGKFSLLETVGIARTIAFMMGVDVCNLTNANTPIPLVESYAKWSV